MSLFVEIGTSSKNIGRLKISNVYTRKSGKTIYEVVYTDAEGMRVEFKLDHRRSEGAFVLVAKVCKGLKKRIDDFFSLPEDKIRDGMIKSSDIPDRYKEACGKFLGVVTAGSLDGEIAYFVTDIEGFLTYKRNGAKPAWD